MYSGTGVCAGQANWQSTTLWKYSGFSISVGFKQGLQFQQLASLRNINHSRSAISALKYLNHTISIILPGKEGWVYSGEARQGILVEIIHNPWRMTAHLFQQWDTSWTKRKT
jgi:hypothetical protein